jgi:hypothetical protein
MPKFIVSKNSNTDYLVDDVADAEKAVGTVQSGGGSSIRHSESYQVREAPAGTVAPVRGPAKTAQAASPVP